MYEVVLSHDAARTLEKATPGMRRRIIAALGGVKAIPTAEKGSRVSWKGCLAFALAVCGLCMKWTPRERRLSSMPLAPGATSIKSEN
jgi:hypothetical protein